MKSQELIQRVQSLYSKGVESDDTRLTARHIFSKLTTANNLLMYQKLSKGESLSDSFYSTINVNLVSSPIFNDYCLNDVNCNISRSECEIPEIQFIKNQPLVKTIVSLDGIVKFNYTTFENLKYLKGNKYTSNKQWYFFKDNFIYFIHSRKMTKVRISAIFDNIEKALSYTCNSIIENCIDMTDIDFPTDDNLIDLIIESAVKELIGISFGPKEDVTNNNADSAIQNTK